MENNNFTTPAPEDIPIRDPEVVAAPEKALIKENIFS